MSWTIRDAGDGDAAALSELAERTFRDAFGSVNAASDMDLHCARGVRPGTRRRRSPIRRLDHRRRARGALNRVRELHRGAPSCVVESPAVEGRRFTCNRTGMEREWRGS